MSLGKLFKKDTMDEKRIKEIIGGYAQEIGISKWDLNFPEKGYFTLYVPNEYNGEKREELRKRIENDPYLKKQGISFVKYVKE